MRTMHNSAKHILVVDDDQSVREALSTGLGFTYVVHTSATGDEALAVLRGQPIVGIILDEVLGGESGLDLVGRFRAVSKAPILVLTGYSTEELAIRAVWAGANGYLRKPVNLEDLNVALTRVIEDPDPAPDFAMKIRHLLNEKDERKSTATAAATRVGMSRRNFYRQFRRATGNTPAHYELIRK